MDPEVLYHGSVKKIGGLFRPKFLIPSKPDLKTDIPLDSQLGVYASHDKEVALIHGIHKLLIGDVCCMRSRLPELIVVIGTIPLKGVFYIYEISPETFIQIKEDEWRSTTKVRPLRRERCVLEEYSYLVRYAEPEEIDRYYSYGQH